MHVADDASELEILLAAHAMPDMPPLVLQGCWDTLSAALIERAGHQAAWLSRAAIAHARFGQPTHALVSSTMLTTIVAEITEATGLALAVDAGDGFGNAFNVERTVRMLVRAGAQAIQMCDAIEEGANPPGRCATDMIGKIKAASDAQSEPLLIARTSLGSGETLAALIDRASAYAEAGADIVAVGDALSSQDRMRFAAWSRGIVPALYATDADFDPAGWLDLALVCQPLRAQAALIGRQASFIDAPAGAIAGGPSAAVRSIAN
jgi:2-methylisocitrate lyase-like PEP mutase family enzyme